MVDSHWFNCVAWNSEVSKLGVLLKTYNVNFADEN